MWTNDEHSAVVLSYEDRIAWLLDELLAKEAEIDHLSGVLAGRASQLNDLAAENDRLRELAA